MSTTPGRFASFRTTAMRGRGDAARMCPGFSLVELMIAIMILGIGLVMVATVFPVGLDMTRDAVQKSIAGGAIDAAVATVKLKVPTVHDLDGNGSFSAALMIPTGVVRPGDPIIRPAESVPEPFSIENDTTIVTPAESDLLPVLGPIKWIDATSALPELNLKTDRNLRAQKTRAFTEQTFWDGDTTAPNTLVTFAMRPQNIPAQYRKRTSATQAEPVITTDRLPLIRLIDPPTSPPPDPMDADGAILNLAPARLRLNEHVYPPIDINDAAVASPTPTPVEFVDNLLKPTNDPDRREADTILAAYAAERRRYNWTVLHHRTATSGARRGFILTIVLTYRTELNAVYARQKDRFDTVNQNLRFYLPDATWAIAPPTAPSPPYDDQIQNLMFPVPTYASDIDNVPTFKTPPSDWDYYDFEDCLYPRPWLVMLYSVSPQAGEVRCSPQVARLLPPGSMFIVARTPPNGPPSFAAGAPHKVLSSSWVADQAAWPKNLAAALSDDTKLATLQIARSAASGLFYVPVWVFPPAIVQHPTTDGAYGEFATNSPVIAVSMREATLP